MNHFTSKVGDVGHGLKSREAELVGVLLEGGGSSTGSMREFYSGAKIQKTRQNFVPEMRRENSAQKEELKNSIEKLN
jgi:hypothetical protein